MTIRLFAVVQLQQLFVILMLSFFLNIIDFSPDDLDEMTDFVSYYVATSAETRQKSTEVEESGCSMEEVLGCIVGKALDNFVIVNKD